MSWIGFDNTFVGIFRAKVLIWKDYSREHNKKIDPTYILLLLKDMSDLEPDVGMSKRAWRIAKDTIKASQGVLEFALLLIYDA